MLKNTIEPRVVKVAQGSTLPDTVKVVTFGALAVVGLLNGIVGWL